MKFSPGKKIAALLIVLLFAHASWAGQKELLEAWSARKQAVTNEVYERLREEGKLPRDGAVQFKAHTKPDPEAPGKVILEVEEVLVLPRPEKGEASAGAVETRGHSGNKKSMLTPITPVILEWESMDVPGYITYESLDIPVGEELVGRFDVRGGVIRPAQPKSGKWLRPGEKKGEKAPAEP